MTETSASVFKEPIQIVPKVRRGVWTTNVDCVVNINLFNRYQYGGRWGNEGECVVMMMS